MRKATAFKRPLDEPVTWELRPNGYGVIHKIDTIDEVSTPDGNMTKVQIRSVADLGDPSIDIAVLVGSIVEILPEFGVKRPQLPELWFWKDRFWTKAITSTYDRLEYYNKKCYLLYEVQVNDANKLFQTIKMSQN